MEVLIPNPDLDFGNSENPLKIENPLLGKFGPKKSRLSVLPENWHISHLEDADPYSNISFLNYKS